MGFCIVQATKGPGDLRNVQYISVKSSCHAMETHHESSHMLVISYLVLDGHKHQAAICTESAEYCPLKPC
jgi:hypothetical protein